MIITIGPFTIETNYSSAPPLRWKKEEHIKRNSPPITYWGIYLDDRYISYTSSKELAEKTKVWMEKWLKDFET